MVDWGIVRISKAAQRTINPIRKVVDKLQVPPNPEKQLISLGLGDPTVFGNMDTHEIVSQAVSKVVLNGRCNGYPPASGDDSAKAALVKRYTTPEAPLTANDIFITSGCSGALELVFGVLANEGDTILLPQPGFTLYATICQSKGIKAEYYGLQPHNNWEVDLVALKEYLKENSRKVAGWLINNPSNPCGSVYSREHLQACLELAEAFKIPVIADEIYEDMVFGSGRQFIPMRTLPSRVPILTCGGMAKRFLVPGWRVGWVLASDHGTGTLDEVRGGLTRLAAVLLGANSLVQKALPEIIENTPPSFYEETNAQLGENARIAAKALEGIPGVSYVEPQGAMYMMVGFDMAQFTGFQEDIKLSEMLITEESVICLPGTVRVALVFTLISFS